MSKPRPAYLEPLPRQPGQSLYMYWRGRIVLRLPFWLWRIAASGTRDRLRQQVSLRTLSEMVQAPDEALDPKGIYIKAQAQAIIDEAIRGDY